MTRLDSEKDIFVELIDFKGIPGYEMVTENEDGSYTIFLNARYSFERQQKACRHAYGHILNDDFETNDIQATEMQAHERKV